MIKASDIRLCFQAGSRVARIAQERMGTRPINLLVCGGSRFSSNSRPVYNVSRNLGSTSTIGSVGHRDAHVCILQVRPILHTAHRYYARRSLSGFRPADAAADPDKYGYPSTPPEADLDATIERIQRKPPRTEYQTIDGARIGNERIENPRADRSHEMDGNYMAEPLDVDSGAFLENKSTRGRGRRGKGRRVAQAIVFDDSDSSFDSDDNSHSVSTKPASAGSKKDIRGRRAAQQYTDNSDSDGDFLDADMNQATRGSKKGKLRSLGTMGNVNTNLDDEAQLDMLLKNITLDASQIEAGGDTDDEKSEKRFRKQAKKRLRQEQEEAQKISESFEKFAKDVRDSDAESAESDSDGYEGTQRPGKKKSPPPENWDPNAKPTDEDIDEALYIETNRFELDSSDDEGIDEYHRHKFAHAAKQLRATRDKDEAKNDIEVDDNEPEDKYKYLQRFKPGKYPHLDNKLSSMRDDLGRATKKSKKLYSRFEREKILTEKRDKYNKDIVIDEPFKLDKARAGHHKFGLGMDAQGLWLDQDAGIGDVRNDIAFMGLADPKKGMKGKFKNSEVRNTRLSGMIYKAINETIVTDVETNPLLGHLGIDISHVEVADYHAICYWRNMGQESDHYVDKQLKALTKQLRYKVQKQINLKRAPKLEFRHDYYEESAKNLSEQFMNIHENPSELKMKTNARRR
ncbi:hypothetical protein SARC_05784 [Sphaeroforma arctica JP610]|uniref:Uncharacterized protein n=1 Tax=Sphaeroforma arctica JP610 TaxID=667725 RepID=A0A0L0FZ71_9EUKA|nr:hypothetical protein SARC_05784 [Sphaeroforma arctica JP610]KNC81934.1 hypothetical protein SARC_05784 [Sphaeroforma arctica JP610]|eukprot:XP_014155836.1 hypothetical protein SARC_05784 [Sphaeroforma arctica JP610]